ncbi:MAG: TetR/AcrR family transcriptional regulator [Desulfovibrionaceae bacterium]|jgi:AcrR family transcriptional regulator|nr:TetR/AcrR family transcriptional regulator [Desulfovibrionaceae bacterium]
MRVKDEKKRERLFDAAVKVFSRYGVEGSSIARIAREAGLSPATIYVYFASKDEMFEGLVLELGRRMSAAMLDGVEEAMAVREALERTWYNLVRYIVGEFEQYLLFELHRETRFFDPESYGRGRAYYTGLFELFRRGRADGSLAPELSDYALRAHLFAPAVRLAKHVVGGQLTLEEARLPDAFARCWRSVAP